MTSPPFQFTLASPQISQEQEEDSQESEEDFETGTTPFQFQSADNRIDETEEDQGLLSYLGDLGTQLISRGLERIGGLPKDAIDVVKGISTGDFDLTEQLPFFPEKLKEERKKSIEESTVIPKIRDFLEGPNLGALGSIPILGSEELKEVSSRITGGKSDPKDEFQRAANEAFETFVDISIPGPGGKFRGFKPSIGKTIARKAGQSIASQLGKEVLKSYGFDESEQEIGKIGTLFGLSLAGSAISGERSIQNAYKDLYESRDINIPNNARASSISLKKDLDALKQELRGIQTESTKPVLSAITELEKDIIGNEIKVTDLTKNMRRINENRGNLYQLGLTKNSNQSLKRNYGKLYNALDNKFESYATSFAPEALEFHRKGNEVFGAFQESRKTSRFLNQVAKKLPYATPIAYIFKESLPTLGLGAVGTTTAALTGLKSFEVMNRIYKSPELSKYYSEVLKNAIKEDALATKRSIDKLNKKYEEMNDK